MMATDNMRTIKSVQAIGPARIALSWSDGSRAEVDLAGWFDEAARAGLNDPADFAKVRVGDWGHSITWPGGAEVGADSLWRETLSATRREDTRRFIDWRLKHGLSLAKAAEALGLSRRMVAYYSNGEKRVPRHILLACRGWEVGRRRARPADMRRGAEARQPSEAR
jgi:hypothetical protein